MFECFFSEYKDKVYVSTTKHNLKRVRLDDWMIIIGTIIVGVLLVVLSLLRLVGIKIPQMEIQSPQAAILVLLVFFGIFAILSSVSSNDRGRRKWMRDGVLEIKQEQIEKLLAMMQKEEYGVNTEKGVDWLIQECKAWMDNTPFEQVKTGFVATYVEKLMLPVLGFIAGLLVADLRCVEAIQMGVFALIMLTVGLLLIVSSMPVWKALTSKNRVICVDLLDNLTFIKATRFGESPREEK